MYNFIRRYAWCFVLGGAFSAAGWNFMTWQFYVAGISILVLEEWSRDVD